MQYWLMKSEPSEFSIDDLAASPGKTAHWDGVRNYQARNMLRDQMKCGDFAFFYHSNCKQPGIVGIVKITREGYPDHTAFDPTDPHFDPKSTPDHPRWYMVDVTLHRKLNHPILLQQLKEHADGKLRGLQPIRRGNRLSVMPVSKAHWQFVLGLEQSTRT